MGPRCTWCPVRSMGPGVPNSLTHSLMFVNFVDGVTLADEDTNSIPTDKASPQNNKLAKLRRHASWVHLAKIHFGKIDWDFLKMLKF